MLYRFLATFLLAFVPTLLFADACVWKLARDGKELYLGGTIHLLDAENAALPEEYDHAYKKADTIVFETDIAATETQEFVAKLQANGVYQDGRNLTSLLSKENYNALSKAFKAYGIPLSPQYTAGFAILILTWTDIELMGYTAPGVDKQYFDRARADNKKILALETADEQLAIISNLGDGYENAYVAESLSERERMHELFDEMIKAWREGDPDTFWEISFAETEKKLPQFYKALLQERNEKWIPLIEKICKQDGTPFILVGAGHLPGKDGVLALLEAKGFTVEQLQTPTPALAR